MRRLVDLLGATAELASSDYAREEAFRNILAKRRGWLEGFESICRRVTFSGGVDRAVPVEIAEKDRPILATAILLRTDYLLTGDKRDFGHLFGQEVEGVRVVSPLMMVENLAGR